MMGSERSAVIEVIEVIDDSYGKRPAYRVSATCFNCGWDGEVRREIGVATRHTNRCPRCGCLDVHARHVFRGRDET